MVDDRLPGEPLPLRPHVYECPTCHATKTAETAPVCKKHGKVMIRK
jgi:hypothetical protein